MKPFLVQREGTQPLELPKSAEDHSFPDWLDNQALPLELQEEQEEQE